VCQANKSAVRHCKYTKTANGCKHHGSCISLTNLFYHAYIHLPSWCTCHTLLHFLIAWHTFLWTSLFTVLTFIYCLDVLAIPYCTFVCFNCLAYISLNKSIYCAYVYLLSWCTCHTLLHFVCFNCLAYISLNKSVYCAYVHLLSWYTCHTLLHFVCFNCLAYISLTSLFTVLTFIYCLGVLAITYCTFVHLKYIILTKSVYHAVYHA